MNLSQSIGSYLERVRDKRFSVNRQKTVGVAHPDVPQVPGLVPQEDRVNQHVFAEMGLGTRKSARTKLRKRVMSATELNYVMSRLCPT
jgi:hypothetical protein